MTPGTVSLVTAAASPVFRVDTGSFLTIVVTAALAGTVAAVAGQRNVFLPVVVLELLFGVIVGPQVLDLAHVNAFTAFFWTSASACCSSLPATRSTSPASEASRSGSAHSHGRCRSRSRMGSAARLRQPG